VISLDGKRIAFGMLVPGPPVRRPVFVGTLEDGASRQIVEDCGGRARLWLDDDLLLAETFGSGLNSFVILDTRIRPAPVAVVRRPPLVEPASSRPIPSGWRSTPHRQVDLPRCSSREGTMTNRDGFS
jgi:hypothetical protein